MEIMCVIFEIDTKAKITITHCEVLSNLSESLEGFLKLRFCDQIVMDHIPNHIEQKT